MLDYVTNTVKRGLSMENGEVIDHQEPVQDEQPVADDVAKEMNDSVPNEDANSVENEEDKSEKMVPLTALQKERKKRQEAEMNAEFQRQQAEKIKQEQPVDDSYKYESATKEDVMLAQQEAIRQVEEKRWIRDNPEKFELINRDLTNFLKQKPSYVTAIDSAENRYEEAYQLMTAFNPKLKPQAKKPKQEREAPHSPSSVPKATAMNSAVDVMSMSDTEFKNWRKGLKKRV